MLIDPFELVKEAESASARKGREKEQSNDPFGMGERPAIESFLEQADARAVRPEHQATSRFINRIVDSKKLDDSPEP